MANTLGNAATHAPRTLDAEGTKAARRNRFFRFICLLLGSLLLVAASLKFGDTSWEPFGQLLVVPARIRIILIEVEVMIALWLYTGLAPVLLRLGAVTYFSLLAVVSLFLAINGELSCGCFGKATVSPWLTFSVDIAAIVALLSVRPAGFGESPLGLIRRHAIILSGIGISMAFAVAGAVSLYGGVEMAWATLLGDSVTVDPPVTDIGDAPIGTNKEFTVTLHNRFDRPVQILGGTSNCSCDATKGLPLTLPSHGSAEVHVIGGFRGDPGPFLREFIFYTDLGFGRHATARFRGQVNSKQ